MNAPLHVLIIEDDFRVAGINAELAGQVAGYAAASIAKSGDEAMAFLEKAAPLPGLILLDVFIPDRSGLELFWEIRTKYPQIAIIMVTAANEIETIAATVRGGAFDYLLKPVDFERFAQALERFRDQRLLLTEPRDWQQSELDRLFGVTAAQMAQTEDNGEELPKGIDQLTLDGVRDFLNASPPEGANAMEAGKAVGISRSTARRYLEHLVASGDAKAQLNYGEIGRPERRYVPWTK